MKESTKILIIVFFLVAFGLVMIYSTSAIYASTRYHDYLYFFKRSVVFALLSIAGLFLGYFVNYGLLGKLSPLVFLAAFAALFLVFTPFGVEAGGARRWVSIGFATFQPSEIMKLAVILFLSRFLASRMDRKDSFFGLFFPALLISAVATIPIFLEPDFGTSVLIFSVCIFLFFVTGVPLKYIAMLFLASLPGLIILVLQAPYRLKRILVFLNPWKDARSTGYQIIQSFVAIQSGGFSGLGLGESRQKLFYLPEAHTDFIFSIIGEELGFAGSMIIMLFFVLFVYCGLKIAVKSPCPFGKLLASGIVGMIGFQAFLNMGVVTGILPTKGLPLPFVSYGGTNLVVTMMSVGILMNVERLSLLKKQAREPGPAAVRRLRTVKV